MATHQENILEAGASWEEAKKIIIMLHGRGGSSRDILSLAKHLDLSGFKILAPQATNNTWYPFGFMMPVSQNQPWLDSALSMIGGMIEDIIRRGFSSEQIYILGFSQGACIALEVGARHARKFGGIIAFTGGLIGDKIYTENYQGDFGGTKVFIGNSDNDPHVPLHRSEKSKEIMESMGAKVTLKIYPGMPHTIVEDEIHYVNANILKS
jgi:phospholipase/carboxylesterase